MAQHNFTMTHTDLIFVSPRGAGAGGARACRRGLAFGLVMLAATCASAAPVKLFDQAPVQITNVAPGVVLVDFGRVAFGNLRFTPAPGMTNALVVHFGEAFSNGRINRKPPGTVRYAKTEVRLTGATNQVIAPAPDQRNTQRGNASTPPAVLTPPEWGVVLPFRWVEIEGWPGELRPEHVRRQAAFASNWDDTAATFESSDALLNRIWDLCQYSIKATTFAGVYVDGDRERIPYEADAYLNQLSHYATDHDIQMARDTYDWLMKYPTWPTEWAPHMVFMAYADWKHTGDTNWLAPRYVALKKKLLLERAGPDGLITSSREKIRWGDIVDWPAGERDGFVFTEVNTVVNAFHLRALKFMAEMAGALRLEAEVADYTAREQRVRQVFHTRLYDAERGVYRDGVGTDHASLHANAIPLAFDLVPSAERARVTRWVANRDMACSVYVAQYFLEALFENEAGTRALELIMAKNDRSWRHMVESGATITWEAWDHKYKPNQDWNHAWGAAPANLLPRYVLGVQPRVAGWTEVVVRPHPGSLSHAAGKIPTPRGPVQVHWRNETNFNLTLQLPADVSARVQLPARENSQGVFMDNRQVAARREGGRWILAEPVRGNLTLEVR
jgi:alpha-L-rhamnosidase